MQNDNIKINRARVHNLKNVSIDIPRDQLVVVTGLSGSGKSSLAFDTLYAEGQRRYVESLSAYARQFIGLMDKPDVDQIEGLSPAISIDQKSSSRNPRSTVGTVTEIYDYLRLLFARVGHPHCPKCDREVAAQNMSQITDQVMNLPSKTRVVILAPMVQDKKGEHRSVLEEIEKAGFVRVRLDGVVMELVEALEKSLDPHKKHSVDVVVDRLVINENPNQGKVDKDSDRSRVADSVETSLDLGNGAMIIHDVVREKDIIFSEHLACVHCGTNLAEIQPRNFSFNSPHGACPDCMGLGTKLEVEPKLVVPNAELSLAQGAIRPWAKTTSRQSWYNRMLDALAEKHGFSVDAPVKQLSQTHLNLVLHGDKGSITVRNENGGGKVREMETRFEGIIPNLERRYHETNSEYIRAEIEKYMTEKPCTVCEGKRLKPEALAVTVGGKSIDKVTALTVSETMVFFDNLILSMSDSSDQAAQELMGGKAGKDLDKTTIDPTESLSERDWKIARQILKEIKDRLQFLDDVGLSYLTLDRSAGTLSGGEAQRIRLATQIGSRLVGVLYILDEPSIGLHQRDNARLISTLKQLRDLGNTVIVVEHDEETMMAADYLIDIGPGAGEQGGEVVEQGTPQEIIKRGKSLTAKYLAHTEEIPVPKRFRKGSGKKLTIKGASAFNLKNITVDIPLAKLVAITGVSGSGKSTLMNEILAKALAQKFYGSRAVPAEHKAVTGTQNLDKVINIDQSPIGRTPRSNPATYTGVFTHIRDLFAVTPEAKIRGYKAGRFSFNVKGGRCEVCEGEGLVKIEMHFLPDVYVECEECKGRRYNPEALEIHYKNKDISEVLQMSVSEARTFFSNIPIVKRKLDVLVEVGLGYIKLGQPATTLSGGEAQRIKLASELSRKSTGKTLYILDEPTTGLHFADVARLLQVLGKLADRGNTVVIIEHNLDVIKSVDHIIDLGPEGGEEGGHIVATGTPREVARARKSSTGRYLAEYFARRKIKAGKKTKSIVKK